MEDKLEIKNVLVKDIKYAPYNPRKISDEVFELTGFDMAEIDTGEIDTELTGFDMAEIDTGEIYDIEDLLEEIDLANYLKTA